MSQKRRTFSPEFKFEAVMELLRGHKPVSDICRERQINDNLLYKWRVAPKCSKRLPAKPASTTSRRGSSS